MSRRKQPDKADSFPALTAPRDKAREELLKQIEAGKEIKDCEIRTPSQLDEAQSARKTWKQFVTLMLQRFLTTEEFATSFRNSGRGSYQINLTPTQRVQYFRDDMQASLAELQSVIDRLDLLDEPAALSAISPPDAVENKEL
jgi:hypothetical protein